MDEASHRVARLTRRLHVSFREGSWENRFEKMGDEAEGVFEEVCDVGFARYGLNRPPLKMGMIPARIRYSPDYLCSAKFVEVQGFGNDNRMKLKLDKLGALHWWADVHPVELFIWATHKNAWCFLTLKQIDDLIGQGSAELKVFAEGKPYWSFDGNACFAMTHKQGEFDRAEAA